MDYLLHSSKGTSWKNHKYISKYVKNGKPVYVYYSKSSSSRHNSPSNRDDSDESKNFFEKLSEGVTKQINRGKKFIIKICSDIEAAKYKWKKFNTPTTDVSKPYLDRARNFIKKFFGVKVS